VKRRKRVMKSHRSQIRSSAVFSLAVFFVLFSFSVAWAQDDNDGRVTQIPSGPYRIAGTVVNAKSGSPLARARVTIGDAKQRQSVQFVITGDDGRFEFHVPSGKYSLDGAKRGYITASYNQHDQFSTAIVTAADLDTESLVLRLQPNAVLSGRVLDEYQEPVRNAHVMLYHESHFQGVSRVDQSRGAMTNDEGRYEITPLAPGTYFVAVKATPWYAVHPEGVGEGSSQPSHVDPMLDVAYPITYYGDTSEPDSATPIPVRGGDRLEADIHLTPVPSLHLIVHVPQEGAPGMVRVPQLQKPTFDGLEQDENASVRQISDGVFELSGIPAGRYTVKMPDANGLMKESSNVDLANGGELDVSSGSLTSKIQFTVQIAGAAGAPSQTQIGLRNGKGRMTMLPVDDKGEVTFSDMTPEKYDVVAVSRQQAYSVTRIVSEAGSISGHTLNVPAGASLNLSLTLVGGSVSVEGIAKRDGKAVAGAMIVLVPKEADADRSRFRRDQSDLDGSFTLPNVIPGAYTVIAIDDGWDLNWSEPGVLAPYLAHGQTVEIGDRARSPMVLEHPVDVQGK
jgi:Carboxypeptidase regulatory-like domain